MKRYLDFTHEHSLVPAYLSTAGRIPFGIKYGVCVVEGSVYPNARGYVVYSIDRG